MKNVVDEIRSLLQTTKDPENGRPINDRQIQEVVVDEQQVRLRLGLTTHSKLLHDDFKEQVRQLLQSKLRLDQSIEIDITDFDRPFLAKGQVGLTCKSVIAVGSGKGGVGKSTVATSMALTLHRAGCKVGLLDADVYGPSVPHLLGASGRPEIQDEKIQPIIVDGMPVLSIGFMVSTDQAIIWRGPMLHSSVTRFLRDTNWGDLDYLIIDMPPGTGDVALTLSQLLPLDRRCRRLYPTRSGPD